ncbi:chaperone modulator CbpM [Sphingobacterium sp. Mn56C]|uniref:chaperone modulator CbpM n=1 Tax=Sphingobacterium sp. Mn56C TaxID=3395261 RepID=UPI003BD08CB2
MSTNLFKVIDICQSNHIETSFVRALQQNGLLELIVIESQEFVHEDHLPQLQRFSSWYYDLEINIQGIEVVEDLVRRIEQLQREVKRLKQV